VSSSPRFPLFLLLTVLAAGRGGAQRADSAAVARGLMREATLAWQRGDSAASFRATAAAARAWPEQGAYQLMLARVASATGHVAEGIAALEAATRLGFAWRGDDPLFARLRSAPPFDALADRAARLQAPLAQSSVFRALPDSLLHPEGVAWDAATGRVFVASVHQRKIVVIEPDGRVRDFVAGGDSLDAVFGVTVDAPQHRLWATTAWVPEQDGGLPPDSSRTALLAFDLTSGRELGRWSAPQDGRGHLFGDVILAPDSGVMVTDSRTPFVFRWRRAEPRLERVDLASSDLVNLQGAAFGPDGLTLWLADWTTGLWHVDLGTGAVRPLRAPADLSTLGCDGLYRLGPHTLLAIQNGVAPARLIRLDLDDAGTTIVRWSVLDRHLPIATEPTAGVLTSAGFLYVANAPWALYDPDGHLPPDVAIPYPVLLLLPLADQAP
jgi:hypothetical protein